MSFSTASYDGASLGEQMQNDFLSARGYVPWTQYQHGGGACSLNSAYASCEELRGGGVVQGTAVQLPRLCIGGYCRSDLRAVVLRQFALERQLGFRVAGLLASDFFRDVRLTLDFERMRMAIE